MQLQITMHPILSHSVREQVDICFEKKYEDKVSESNTNTHDSAWIKECSSIMSAHNNVWKNIL